MQIVPCQASKTKGEVVKIHKVSTEHFNDALEFQKQNGFVNPAVVLIVSECGTEPMRFTDKWQVTDCKRCLAKRVHGFDLRELKDVFERIDRLYPEESPKKRGGK